MWFTPLPGTRQPCAVIAFYQSYHRSYSGKQSNLGKKESQKPEQQEQTLFVGCSVFWEREFGPKSGACMTRWGAATDVWSDHQH